jgi:hypothetical protein
MHLFLALILLCIFSVKGATVAHYKFETPETDRSMLHLMDSSGNGHHGLVLGREPFEVSTNVPAKALNSTTALDARGRRDYAIIPHHLDFAPSGDWTIEFFVKAPFKHHDEGGETNIAGIYSFLNTNLSYTILAKPNTNDQTRFGAAWAFHYQPANGFVIATVSYGTDDGATLFVGEINDGEWHHVALVYRTSIENELRIYFDGATRGGINQHGGNKPILFGTGPIYIGAFSPQDETFSRRDRNFDGLIDELRFSDVALDEGGFAGDLGWRPLQTEIHAAVEINFRTQAGTVYDVQRRAGGGDWVVEGSVLGTGATNAFFIREKAPGGEYRVVIHAEEGATAVLPSEKFEAIEVRFPTEDGLLYQITLSATIGHSLEELVFLLGDGAKQSYFERIVNGETRFFEVYKY